MKAAKNNGFVPPWYYDRPEWMPKPPLVFEPVGIATPESALTDPGVGPVYVPPANPPVNEYVNTDDGITPIGVPVDNDLISRLARTPSRWAAQLLPKGAVNPWLAIAVTYGAPLLALLLLWWLYRRVTR